MEFKDKSSFHKTWKPIHSFSTVCIFHALYGNLSYIMGNTFLEKVKMIFLFRNESCSHVPMKTHDAYKVIILC